MRKNAARLIRNNAKRLHRTTGSASIFIPPIAGAESITDMRLFGNISLNPVGEHRGIGESSGGGYVIKTRVHGRNALSGIEFANIHKSSGICTSSSISGELYSFTQNTAKNGTVVIKSSHIRFRENTAYTIASEISLASAPKGGKRLGLSFIYSDYSIEHITVTSLIPRFTFTAHSRSDKTLMGFVADAENSSTVGIVLSSFGIFEGAYSSYEEAFSPYIGTTNNIAINRPLYRIGGCSDFLDFSKKQAHFFTEKAALGTELIPEESEYAGVFKFTLKRAARVGSAIYSLHENLSENALISGGSGLAISKCGRYIYYRPSSNILDLNEILNKLTASPVYAVYEADDEMIIDTDVSYQLYSEGTGIEILSQTSPHLFYAEYL